MACACKITRVEFHESFGYEPSQYYMERRRFLDGCNVTVTWHRSVVIAVCMLVVASAEIRWDGNDDDDERSEQWNATASQWRHSEHGDSVPRESSSPAAAAAAAAASSTAGGRPRRAPPVARATGPQKPIFRLQFRRSSAAAGGAGAAPSHRGPASACAAVQRRRRRGPWRVQVSSTPSAGDAAQESVAGRLRADCRTRRRRRSVQSCCCCTTAKIASTRDRRTDRNDT